MVCVPEVLKVKPFGQVMEPAFAVVKKYAVGRVAAGSELVNWIWLLINVSRLPWYITVTVTVNGVPAITVEGAVN